MNFNTLESSLIMSMYRFCSHLHSCELQWRSVVRFLCHLLYIFSSNSAVHSACHKRRWHVQLWRLRESEVRSLFDRIVVRAEHWIHGKRSPVYRLHFFQDVSVLGEASVSFYSSKSFTPELDYLSDSAILWSSYVLSWHFLCVDCGSCWI